MTDRSVHEAPPAAAVSARRCPNCGAAVSDRYCPRCGQQWMEGPPSLRRIAAEFADDQLSLNGSLPRSLAWLLFRPGFLTREYSAGRIVRYIRPFRLFLVTTVLFFLALTWTVDPAGWAMSQVRADAPSRELSTSEARQQFFHMPLDIARVPAPLRPAARRLIAQRDWINSLPEREAIRVVMEGLMEGAAKAVFVLVPAFAALLALLHFRRRRSFAEHFVFGLHFHAAASLFGIIGLAVGSPVVWALLGGWMLVYLLVALKTVYEQPWWLAGLKWGVIVFGAYPMMIGLGATVASVLAIVLA